MTAAWTEDEQYYIWQGDIRVAKTFDPATKSAIILLGPDGGVADIPALVKGDPGTPATIDSTINFTALAWDDPTVDSASFSTLTPGTSSVSPVYRLNLSLHRGAPGDPGTPAILTASDLVGTATDTYLLSKTTVSGVNKVTWVAPKVTTQYWPASVSNTSGTDGQNRTLATVTVPAQPFPYRLRVQGQTVITGTANTRVDLIARLDNAVSGDVIGRGFGVTGASDRLTMVSGVPTGSATSVGLVAVNTACTVFLRTEQQASTTDTYSTAAATTTFLVEVVPQ